MNKLHDHVKDDPKALGSVLGKLDMLIDEVSKMKETDPKGKKEVNGQGVDFSSSNKQL
jgi:hypothetical protein